MVKRKDIFLNVFSRTFPIFNLAVVFFNLKTKPYYTTHQFFYFKFIMKAASLELTNSLYISIAYFNLITVATPIFFFACSSSKGFIEIVTVLPSSLTSESWLLDFLTSFSK
jgi:hypothetical protein